MKAEKSPIQSVMAWIRRQPPKVKAFLGVVTAMTVLVFLRVIVHEHDNLFIASEAVHAVGIAVLIYKLTKEKTCAGITGFRNASLDLILKLCEFGLICYDRICFIDFDILKFDDCYRDISQDTGANGFVSGCEIVL